MLAIVARVVAEVVVKETEVAKVVITLATTTPSPPKTLMLSIAIALRRRRKLFGSSLLTIKTFMTTHARYAIAPPRRMIVICALSADSDRIL